MQKLILILTIKVKVEILCKKIKSKSSTCNAGWIYLLSSHIAFWNFFKIQGFLAVMSFL